VLAGIDALKAMNAHTAELLATTQAARPTIEQFLAGIDRSIASPVEAFIKDLQWMIAGGGQFTSAFKQLQDAVAQGLVTPEQGITMGRELFIAIQRGMVTAGLQTKPEALNAIGQAFGWQIANGVAAGWEKQIGVEGILGKLIAAEHEIAIEIALQDRRDVLSFIEGETIGAETGKPIDRAQDITASVLTTDPTGIIAWTMGGPYFVDIQARIHGGQYTAPGGGGSVPTGGGTSTGAGGGAGGGGGGSAPAVAMQHGGVFTVPPGFPGDTYPMRVSSGERVTVTPAGKAARGGFSVGTINVFPSPGMDEEILAALVISRLQRTALAESRAGAYYAG
jgi:uncharacterized membrane protein YgcG